ncbi:MULTISPECIES: hypothetical protein [unclassified Schlesneria]|uniref:hypothetical protein n=1 Tax=Schlesneria TaxID=656899 RepID=UPI0035A035B3
MRESFSQSRMNRCIRIQQEILSNWQETTVLDCTIRATEPIAGLPLSELRHQYFAVGFGTNLTDLPFTDMLVVYSMIVQAVAALRAKVASNEKAGRIQFRITTDFPDPDAALMLSQMKIETPFDESPFLEFAPPE